MALNAPQRGFVIDQSFFLVGHQSVEIDVRVDVTIEVTIEIRGVDFKDFDDQRVDVFDLQIQRDGFISRVANLVRWIKVEIDARIQAVLADGNYIMGPEVKQLEEKLPSPGSFTP